MQRKEWNQGKTHFFGHGGAADLDALEALLQQGVQKEQGVDSIAVNKIAAVFTEFPSNPLLKCPDLKRYDDRGV